MQQRSLSTSTPSAVCKPQLTSLIDVMTILLVFLMKSFSVEGNLITPAADLQLPESTSKEAPAPATTLEITAGTLSSHGGPIAPLPQFTDDDSMVISPLADWLTARKGILNREVMLQADRHIPFSVIKRVMFTCSKAGFDDFTILVQQEG